MSTSFSIALQFPVKLPGVKKLLSSLMLLCTLSCFAQNYPITNVNISMPASPDANTANWGLGASPFTISAKTTLDSNRQVDVAVIESRILITIKKGGSKVCGSYTSSTAPYSSFNNAVQVWNGRNAVSLMGQDCVLQPGDYQLCVQFFGSRNGADVAFSDERCKPFTIKGSAATDDITYQSPQNISPADGAVLKETDAKMPVIFRWTPMVPKPQGNVTYRLKVWQIIDGQNTTAVIKANQPIIEREINNQTQFILRNLFEDIGILASDKEQTNTCIWSIQVVSEQGQVLGNSESTRFVVRLSSENPVPLQSPENPNKCCNGSNQKDLALYEKGGKKIQNLKCAEPTVILINEKQKNCDKDLIIKASANCGINQKECPSRVEFILTGNRGYNAKAISTLTIPASLRTGNYVLQVDYYCGTDICKSCKFEIKKDCLKQKDSIVLVSPSPYCPSNTNTPGFSWIDSLKDEMKFTYTLKVVEMNIGDTALLEFDKRKTLFEIKNLTKQELKFPDKAERLKMSRLYAYRVQKYNKDELLAQSEIFPFVIIDPNLPFVSEMLCCQSNLLQNGDVTDGVVNGVLDERGKAGSWKAAYGKPIVVISDDGCGEPNYFNISGSAKSGAAISQPVKLQKGRHYRLTACVRLCKDASLDYAFVNAVAYNGTLPTTGLHPSPSSAIAKIGWSGRIKAKSWVTFTMPVFTPTIDFEKIAIYCTSENDEMVCLDIDKICFQETDDSLSCDDFQYTENGSLIIPTGLQTADIRNRDTTYYEDHRGRLVDLYPGYNGTTSFYQNDNQCSSIGGTIPAEVLNVNINDSLANLGIEGGIAALDSILNTITQDTTAAVVLPPITPPTFKCEKSYMPDVSQPFSGRDIIFVHGLNLSHLCDKASAVPGGSVKNWPDDASEFYGTGYYHQKAVDSWSDHINEWLKTRGYKNRYLVVAYNCTQRADVAAHAILTQIRDAMQNGTGVICPSNNPNPKWCFGKDAVIISHSTGALVTDIAMSIAEKSKTDPIIQARFGNVGYIPDNIKVHLAPNGAIRGSKMATVFLAMQSAPEINAFLAQQTGCSAYSSIDNDRMKSIAYQSILIDLQPAVATGLWMPLINAFNKVTTITLAGGHSFGTHEQVPFLNVALHPGFDDGVVTMGSQNANPWFETGPHPVGYNRQSGLYKLYDMGIAYRYSLKRANRYFLNQTAFAAPPFVGGGSTAYLSPTGMVQPVDNVPSNSNPENRLLNHYSFLQSASDHYIGTRGKSVSEGYRNYNHIGTSGFRTNNYDYFYESGRHWEESLVITNPSLFANGFINPSIINLPEEIVRGEYVDWEVWGPRFRFRKPFQIDIIWDLLFHIRFTIWERKYHLMSDTETECQMGYMYKYILR